LSERLSTPFRPLQLAKDSIDWTGGSSSRAEYGTEVNDAPKTPSRETSDNFDVDTSIWAPTTKKGKKGRNGN
jgi:hypothetical protein